MVDQQTLSLAYMTGLLSTLLDDVLLSHAVVAHPVHLGAATYRRNVYA